MLVCVPYHSFQQALLLTGAGTDDTDETIGDADRRGRSKLKRRHAFSATRQWGCGSWAPRGHWEEEARRARSRMMPVIGSAATPPPGLFSGARGHRVGGGVLHGVPARRLRLIGKEGGTRVVFAPSLARSCRVETREARLDRRSATRSTRRRAAAAAAAIDRAASLDRSFPPVGRSPRRRHGSISYDPGSERDNQNTNHSRGVPDAEPLAAMRSR